MVGKIARRVAKYVGLEHYLGQSGSLRSHILESSGNTLILKILRIGFSFLISLVLARSLGAEKYGVYKYAISWVIMLAFVSSSGFSQLLTRELSKNQRREEWGNMRGIVSWSNKSVTVLSVICSSALFLYSLYYEDSITSYTLRISSVLILIHAFLNTKRALLRGIGKIVQSIIPKSLVYPSFFLVSILAFSYWSTLSASKAIALHAGAILAALGTIVYFEKTNMPDECYECKKATSKKKWMKSFVPFLLSTLGPKINNEVPIITLGLLADPKFAGVFAIAKKGSNLVKFILKAVNMPLAPIFSSLYSEKDMQKLERVIVGSAKLIFSGAILIAVPLMVFGDQFLLLFGKEFETGYSVLVILCIGQLVNASMGSVGLVLNMTEYENYTAAGVLTSSIFNVILCILLVPIYKSIGAAIAFLTSIIMWNIIITIFVYSKLSINATAFGDFMTYN